MLGVGTIVNAVSIIVGGLCGILFGSLLKERHQETIIMACGVSVLFIGIAWTMPYMLDNGSRSLPDGGTLPMVGCLALGALIGEVLDIERRIEMFGEWLKAKTGNAKDGNFVDGVYRRYGDCGSDSGWNDGRLVYPGCQAYTGSYHNYGHDMCHGPWAKGVCS